MEDKDFYTVKEFAIKLRVHENTVRKGIRTGHIHAFRIGSSRKSSFRIPNSEFGRMGMFTLDEVVENIVKQKRGWIWTQF